MFSLLEGSKMVQEVSEFVGWYEEQVYNKLDSDINYVDLGCEAHKRFYELLIKYPELNEITGKQKNVTAEERVYSCTDEMGNQHDYTKETMSNLYLISGGAQYSLKDCDKRGPNTYMSYASYEKSKWESVIKELKVSRV